MKTNAEQLREYKELLDSGVITEDEFNHLKTEIISQMRPASDDKEEAQTESKPANQEKKSKKMFVIIGAVLIVAAVILVALVLKKPSSNSQLPLGVNWGDDLKSVQKVVEKNAKIYETTDHVVHGDGIDTLGYNSEIDFYVTEDRPLDEILVFIHARNNTDKGSVEADEIVEHFREIYGEEIGEVEYDENYNSYTHKWKKDDEKVSVIVYLDANMVAITYSIRDYDD